MQIVLPLRQWLRKRADCYPTRTVRVMLTLKRRRVSVHAIPFKPTTNVRQFPAPTNSHSNTSEQVQKFVLDLQNIL